MRSSAPGLLDLVFVESRQDHAFLRGRMGIVSVGQDASTMGEKLFFGTRHKVIE